MTVTISQPERYPGGRALVRVDGAPALDPLTLKIGIQRLQPTGMQCLDPRVPERPWGSELFEFPPLDPRLSGSAVEFDLDHSVVFHMTPNMPFVLRLSDAGGGPVHEERGAWTGVRRLHAEIPKGWTPPPRPVLVEKNTPAEPPPSVEKSKPAEPSPQAPTGESNGRRRKLIMLGLFALVVIGALAVWRYGGSFIFGASPQSSMASVDGARRFIATNPLPQQSYDLALKYAAEKSLDGAFLLYRHAAQGGKAEAALALGKMYDPATHSPDTSPLPAANPQEAVDWYKSAADANIAEAQYLLGKLLLSGKTEGADDPEKGARLLQKAADQGHEEARKALPK